MKGNRGFLLIDVLIAGLILSASIAATMYLFRLGFEHLQDRAHVSNALSSKLPQSLNLLQVTDLEQKQGVEEMGGGVTLAWESEILARTRPVMGTGESSLPGAHELFLYQVNFKLIYGSHAREYELHAFRYKTLGSPSEGVF